MRGINSFGIEADDTLLYSFLFKFSGDTIELLSHCLTAVIKWLKASKLKQNPDKLEMILVRKVDILKDLILPTFSWVQLTLAY